MTARVTGIRSIEFGVKDLDATDRFYQESWGLAEVARDAKTRWLRATGADHHIVVLHEVQAPGLVRVNLGADSRADVAALYERLCSAGVAVVGAPAVLKEPGNGYGFAFRDVEGREFRVCADVAAHPDTAPGTDRPFKISHVVLNSTQTDAEAKLFVELLGFRLRDQTRMMSFLGCNADHHSLAFTRFGNDAVNHVAFDLPSIDAIMRGSGRLKKHGYRMEWGVGRHGPGANVFAYFIDPSETVVEYTAEMEQVDDATYVGKTPEEWAARPSLDAWGLADPPTQRFERSTGALGRN